ncbi:MAG: hypothetical protein JJE21_03090 [Spirochaetaceae bacterium]|nr:hypothetical protein [Spirochaetaceae bacterium]
MAIYRVEYKSKTLSKTAKFIAIIPNDVSKATKKKYSNSYNRATKTLYLLHGYNGDETTFLRTTAIREYSNRYNIAIILPSCRNSYYLNRDGDREGYQTYISKELVHYVRKVFNLSQDREDTFMGGVSMGGYGAIQSALLESTTFSKVIAISPALIIENLQSPNPDFNHGSYNFLLRTFGRFEDLPTSDNNPKVLFNKNIEKGIGNPNIFIAIGLDDFLLAGCRDFQAFLSNKTNNYTYIEDEGIHSEGFLLKYLEISIQWLLKK